MVESGGIYKLLYNNSSYTNEDFTDGHYYRLTQGVGGTAPDNSSSSSAWACLRLKVKAGQIINLKTIGGSSARAYALTNINRTILSVAPEYSDNSSGITLNVEQDGYLYVNTTTVFLPNVSVVISSNKTKIEQLWTDVTELLQDDISSLLYPKEIESTRLTNYSRFDENNNNQIITASSTLYINYIHPTVTGDYMVVVYDITEVTRNDKIYTNNIGVFVETPTTGSIPIQYIKHGYTLEAGKVSITKVHIETGQYLAVCNSNRHKVSFFSNSIGILKVEKELNNSDNPVSSKAVKDVTDSIVSTINNINKGIDKKLINRKVDIKKSSLKVLHLGNSFMNNSTDYLSEIINAANVDISDMCLYKAYSSGASFESWYKCYHDEDSGAYSISKSIGGVTISNVSGSGGAYDGGAFRNALSNAQWDIIILQPVSTAPINFDDWEKTDAGGYLIALTRLIRTLQPQAEIGMNFIHASYYAANVKGISQAALWECFAENIKKFINKYDVDFIIPYGTAIENIKDSTINTTSYGFEHDAKHLAAGVGRYVASATYFQSLISPRYGVSILGNTYRHDVTEEKSGATYPDELISVTNENAYACQMAAVLACNDMYDINNPDGVTL